MNKKFTALIGLTLSIAMLFAGCSGGSSFAETAPAMTEEYAYDESMDYPAEEGETTLFSGSEIDSSALSDRKIIRNVHMELETRDFDQAVEDIMRLTNSSGGYVENSDVWGNSLEYDYNEYYQRSADYTLRIPESELDRTLEELSGLYNQTYRNESVDDITDIYYDVDSRLSSLRVQEERLLAMLEQATTLEEMLTIESYLADVHYQIEGLTGERNRMDSQVDFATLYISLREVVEYSEIVAPTFGSRIADTFDDSLEFIVDFGQGVVLVLVAILPFIIVYGGLIAIVVFAIIAIAKKAKKARDKKRGNNPPPPPPTATAPVTPAAPVAPPAPTQMHNRPSNPDINNK